MKNNVNYRYDNMFNDFDDIFDNLNLIQMVEFKTWSRVVNNVLRESIIDHIYVTDPTMFIDLQSTKPCFGDHLLITIKVIRDRNNVESTATDIYESVMQLKLKNCEGYDRIPQRILIDGINALIVPLSHLFSFYV